MDKKEVESIIKECFNDLPRLATQHNDINKAPLFKAIDMLIDRKLKELEYNWTKTGIIKKDNGDGTYEVSYGQSTTRYRKKKDNGKFEFVEEDTTTLPAITGMKYEENDIVYIEVVNNNYSNKYIKCKRPKGL